MALTRNVVGPAVKPDGVTAWTGLEIRFHTRPADYNAHSVLPDPLKKIRTDGTGAFSVPLEIGGEYVVTYEGYSESYYSGQFSPETRYTITIPDGTSDISLQTLKGQTLAQSTQYIGRDSLMADVAAAVDRASMLYSRDDVDALLATLVALPDALGRKTLAQIGDFALWLREQGARGWIGEVGVPQDQRWLLLLQRYYIALSAAGVDVTAWSSSRGLGADDNTGIYVSSDGTAINLAKPQAAVVEAFPDTATTRRGVNWYGATNGVTSSANIDEAAALYPTQADMNYLSSRGVRVMRLGIRWERIQRTLGGVLHSGEVAKVQAAIACAAAASPTPIKILLGVGDNAQYWYAPDSGTAKTIYTMQTAGGNLNGAHLVDLWGRLSDMFKADATVIAYGLMNEPFGLQAEAGPFAGTTLFDWETAGSGVDGWTANGASATTLVRDTVNKDTGTGSLKITKTDMPTSGFGNVLLYDGDAGKNRGGSGATLKARVRLDSSVTGNWQAHVFYTEGGPSYATHDGANFPLVAGSWVDLAHNFTSLTNLNAMGVAIETASGTHPATLIVNIDNFQRGAATTYSAAKVWEAVSQQVLTSLRTTKTDTKLVLVGGYEYSGVPTWRATHAAGWIADTAQNFRYEAHHYFDNSSGGTYPLTYADYNVSALGQGW